MKVALGSVFLVAALVAIPVSSDAATPQTPAAQQTDKTIDERVEARINADAQLKKHSIVVTTDNGVVTLTGVVTTQAESDKAARLANVTGVSRVNNNLVVTKEVKGTAGRAVEKTKEGAENVGEKTKEGAKNVGEKTKEGAKNVGEKTADGAKKVGEKTKEGLSKTGEVITDAWITSRVSSKFIGEDLLKDSNINVDTNNHVVTLRGTVMTQAAKARAVAQAKAVEGVRSVVDQLTVGPRKP
jgi:osmotically-inducible protein OsmY